MSDLTALPNLHPALVHFPIALVPVALLFEIAAWVRSRDGGLVRAAVILHALAGLAAASAYLAGRSAEDSLVDVPAAAQGAIAAHADAAFWALATISTVVALRLALAWRDHRSRGRASALGRSVGVFGGALALVVLAVAADRGGALVYRHGVAVEGVAADRSAPAESRPVAEAGEGMPVREGRTGERVLEVDGTELVPVEGEPGDVVLEVELDLSGFDGTVALLHHFEGPTAHGAFELGADGAVRLETRSGEDREVLATGEVEPRDRLRLAVSVAGHHLKGMVDGETVLHAHGDSGPGRGVALSFSGRGRVVLGEIRVTPLGNAS